MAIIKALQLLYRLLAAGPLRRRRRRRSHSVVAVCGQDFGLGPRRFGAYSYSNARFLAILARMFTSWAFIPNAAKSGQPACGFWRSSCSQQENSIISVMSTDVWKNLQNDVVTCCGFFLDLFLLSKVPRSDTVWIFSLFVGFFLLFEFPYRLPEGFFVVHKDPRANAFWFKRTKYEWMVLLFPVTKRCCPKFKDLASSHNHTFCP